MSTANDEDGNGLCCVADVVVRMNELSALEKNAKGARGSRTAPEGAETKSKFGDEKEVGHWDRRSVSPALLALLLLLETSCNSVLLASCTTLLWLLAEP